MNRTIALFVTLAILLAHTLALHQNAAGEIAQPYDLAHVGYRVARNLVQTGSPAWNPGLPAAESYPSILWIGVAAVAERLYLPVNMFCITAGVVSALLTVIVLAQFSPHRLAGIIAPLLFVFSGSVAAAAASGTENATFGLLLAGSFLAYERRRPGWLGLGLVLACLARPEGILFAAALFAIELARRLRRPRGERGGGLLAVFALPLATELTVAALRRAWTGHWLSPWMAAVIDPEPGLWREGLRFTGDFFVSSGGPLLFAVALWYLARGALSGLGARAFVLTLWWIAIVVLSGGGTLPFGQRMAPILAILFVAAQEAMMLALDSRRPLLPRAAWVLFVLALSVSALASKFPGDLGPLRVEGLHRAWMTPHTAPRFGYRQPLGREGLDEEIVTTERLRAIGLFMREELDPSHTVLCPWPGAIGYLSRLRVFDPLGRTTPAPGETRTGSWTGLPRADVVAVLARQPDYIVPTLHFGEDAPTIQSIAAQWALNLDEYPDLPQRSLGIREELKTYELITVPTIDAFTRPGTLPRNRFHLMRRKALGLSPRLELSLDQEGGFRVDVRHRSHEQLADLRVQAVDARGRTWSLRPTGDWDASPQRVARCSILLFPTGTRTVELFRGRLPEEVGLTQLRAVLRNPGSRGEYYFNSASDEVVLPLR